MSSCDFTSTLSLFSFSLTFVLSRITHLEGDFPISCVISLTFSSGISCAYQHLAPRDRSSPPFISTRHFLLVISDLSCANIMLQSPTFILRGATINHASLLPAVSSCCPPSPVWTMFDRNFTPRHCKILCRFNSSLFPQQCFSKRELAIGIIFLLFSLYDFCFSFLFCETSFFWLMLLFIFAITMCWWCVDYIIVIIFPILGSVHWRFFYYVIFDFFLLYYFLIFDFCFLFLWLTCYLYLEFRKCPIGLYIVPFLEFLLKILFFFELQSTDCCIKVLSLWTLKSLNCLFFYGSSSLSLRFAFGSFALASVWLEW